MKRKRREPSIKWEEFFLSEEWKRMKWSPILLQFLDIENERKRDKVYPVIIVTLLFITSLLVLFYPKGGEEPEKAIHFSYIVIDRTTIPKEFGIDSIHIMGRRVFVVVSEGFESEMLEEETLERFRKLFHWANIRKGYLYSEEGNLIGEI
jgi:hypothetical protein